MATYEKNFITQAVFQLNFDPIVPQKFINFLADNLDKDGFGHNWEQKEVTHENIEVTDDTLSREKGTGIIRICNDGNGKKIQVTEDAITILFDRAEYKTQEIITSEFNFLNSFIVYFKIEFINRLLLRYVNEFEPSSFPDVNRGEWGKYINKELLSSIDIGKAIGDLRESLVDSVVCIDDYYLRLKYGIWNRFSPNPIVNWRFVLDIAVRSKNPIETANLDISAIFKKYKGSLNNVFESSITDDMRNLLIKINE